MANVWNAIVRFEHAIERAIGLVPPADPVDDDAAAGAPSPAPVAAVTSSSSSSTSPSSSPATSPSSPASSSSSSSSTLGAPTPGSPIRAQRIRRIGDLLARFWPELTGQPSAPPQALELAIAQAGLESSFGAGWIDKSPGSAWALAHPESPPQGDMRGSNNLGARQCGLKDQGGASWRCVPYGDTEPQADGSSKPIPADFRFYGDGDGRTAEENGAYYFLRDLTKTWPVLPELVAGDITGYAHRLGPDKAHGGLFYYAGFGKTFAERERGYRKRLAQLVPEVAAALGHGRVFATMSTPDPALGGFGRDDHAMLRAWNEGRADQLGWKDLDVGPYRIRTSTEPLAVGLQPQVLPFTDLITIARSIDALPLTKAIADARWAAADIKTIVEPLNDPRGALMNDPSQNAAFLARRGPNNTQGLLRHGDHKVMILGDGMKPFGPNSMLFYDWRRADGSTWQQGLRSDHDLNWIEYDSFGDLVSRWAIYTPTGEVVDLLELLRTASPLGGPVPRFLLDELVNPASPSRVSPVAAVPNLTARGAALGVA